MLLRYAMNETSESEKLSTFCAVTHPHREIRMSQQSTNMHHKFHRKKTIRNQAFMHVCMAFAHPANDKASSMLPLNKGSNNSLIYSNYIDIIHQVLHTNSL
jgi:hypothetical protein